MARILVVEDNPANVEILQRLLARIGHEVLVAGNMQDAIRCATEDNVALILMDIGIPDAPGGAPQDDGGLQVTRVLKAQAETQTIPIIATSAFAMLDEKQRFLEAGCNDVQSKPYEFSALIQSINQQLEAAN